MSQNSGNVYGELLISIFVYISIYLIELNLLQRAEKAKTYRV